MKRLYSCLLFIGVLMFSTIGSANDINLKMQTFEADNSLTFIVIGDETKGTVLLRDNVTKCTLQLYNRSDCPITPKEFARYLLTDDEVYDDFKSQIEKLKKN